MRFSVIVLLLGICLLTLQNLVKERLYVSARDQLNFGSDYNASASSYSAELANLIKSVSQGPFSSNAGRKLAINYLVQLAREVPDSTQKYRAYCQAFELASKLKDQEPHNSRVLVNWLYWQQVLDRSECTQQLDQAGRDQLIQKAIANNPTNVDVLYQVALLYGWQQQSDQARPQFRRVIELASKLSAGQEQEILRHIKTPEDIIETIPGRFPQILRWMQLIKDQRPELFSASTQQLRALQLAALDQSLTDYTAGLFPVRIHIQNLNRLAQTTDDDQVRRMADSSLASAIGEKTALGQYLLKRASLERGKINRAYFNYDSQPQRNSFSIWNSNNFVYLDKAYNSVGLYKALDEKVKIIELVNVSSQKPINTANLKIFTSSDNQTWIPVNFKFFQISNPNVPGTWLILEPDQAKFKYLKLNFHTTSRVVSFGNAVDRFINLYN